MSTVPKLDRQETAARAARVALVRATYYCNLLTELSRQFETAGSEREAALSRLRIEWHNIFDAHRWVVRQVPESEETASLAQALLRVSTSVLNLVLTPVQKIEWLEALLPPDADPADEQTLALIGNLANAYAKTDQVAKAIEHLEQVLAQSRRQGFSRIEAQAIGNLANLWAGRGDLNRAMRYQQQSLDKQRSLQSRLGEASVLNNIGHIHRRQSEYLEAENAFREAYEIFADLNERRHQATVLGGLGTIARLRGKSREAFDYQTERLAIVEAMGSEAVDKVNALIGLGLAQYDLESYADAEQSFLSALSLARHLRSRANEAASLGNLGLVYSAKQDYDNAYRCHEQQLAIAKEVRDRLTESNALGGLGTAARHLGRLDEAIKFKLQQQQLAEKINNPKGKANALGGLSILYLAKGDSERAWSCHEASIQLFQDISDDMGKGRQLVNGAHILASEKKNSLALALLDQAEQVLAFKSCKELEEARVFRKQIAKDNE